MRRVAVLLAGGFGERFWPVSRPERPKQLLKLSPTGETLLQDALFRAESLVGNADVYVVCSESLLATILAEIPGLDSHIFAEPAKRNTAGAIVWATALLRHLHDEADLVFGFFPSDHRVYPLGSFRKSIDRAYQTAESSPGLVTVGIKPTRAETGYGYILRGPEIGTSAYHCNAYIEKPPTPQAEEFLSSGEYLWNSGMFFWRLDRFEAELAEAAPEFFRVYQEIVEAFDRGDTAAAIRSFSQLPDSSIDHALLETSKRLYVVDADFNWDDLGAWDSLLRTSGVDSDGNLGHGRSEILESRGCLAYNATNAQTIHILGAQNLVVVATEDEILVCPADHAQEVRKLQQKRRPPTPN
jgi:mannose-1-phosphate guanylyltransferase